MQAPGRVPSLVIDASAAIELVLGSRFGRLVAQRLDDPSTVLHAPHLLAVETAQTLRRLNASGEPSPQRALAALEDLSDLDVNLYEHEPLLARMWQLRHNFTAYDAAYVALAEVLEAPVLTLDQQMADSPGTDATFELVAD